MNWQHLSAFVWLRWRLMANQWRRAGSFNTVLMMIIAVGAIVSAAPLFVGCWVLGTFLIPMATPAQLMYAWDGILFVFLSFWTVGLMSDLQRSDPLSLSKVLHLPVPANWAFLINYVSSLVRLSLIVFVPIMLGYSLALIQVKGPALLPVLPALAAFLLMVTALTYQFQGWLGSLISNPRRRRTAIMAATLVFVMIFQLPNLLNMFVFSGPGQDRPHASKRDKEQEELLRALKAGEIAPDEYTKRVSESSTNFAKAAQEAHAQSIARLERTARLANMILPVGWLPFGVATSAEGQALPAWLGILAMSAIGAVSLRRAYTTTVGQFQGQASNRKVRAARPGAAATTTPTAGQGRPRLLVEWKLPVVSESVAGIALASFRSLLRAPEAKMSLLTPLIMGMVFGSMLFHNRHDVTELIRPLLAFGGVGFMLLSVLQLAANQFGLERDGFRVYVLSAAPRRDILLGKNLAHAPIALIGGMLTLLAVQILSPMRLDHLLGLFPQILSMYLLACVFTNFLSIYTPIYLSPGSLKASNPKISTVLIQMLVTLILLPMTEAVTLLPLGVEALLWSLGRPTNIPVFLILSLVEVAVIVLLYRASLTWLGGRLQAREQAILEVVTNRGL